METIKTSAIESYVAEVSRLAKTGKATEHTFRVALAALIDALAPGLQAVNEPKRTDCGAPDYIVQDKTGLGVFYVEAKDLGDDDLDGKNRTGHKEQFDRYKAALDTIIFTDYLDFRLYRHGQFASSVRIADWDGEGKVSGRPAAYADFAALVADAAAGDPQKIDSAKRLAELMAGKARLLQRNAVEYLAPLSKAYDDAPDGAKPPVTPILELLLGLRDVLMPDVGAWGSAATFVLWSPESGRLRFCGLDERPESAWAYQTNDVYTTAGTPVHSAVLVPVAGEGMGIDPSDCLGSGNAPGVLAFEAADEVCRPEALMLLVCVGGDTLFSYSLPLSISSVDRMHRWHGLRHVCGGASSIPDRTGEPWNMPDEETCDVDVFFLHGFNVSEADARNWSRHVFKRLWLSGSRARFHGFSWHGDYNLAGSQFNGLHYHQDVYHALKTASAFKSSVEAAQPVASKRVLMAHSLRNMVASESLRQGLSVGRYFMFNAAVASEAVDGTLQAGSSADDGYLKYVPSDWHGYTNSCWAANWFCWFQNDSADARGKMGWPDYFSAALGNAGTVYNYYSSGDEVFEEMPSTPSLLSGVFHWPTFQSSWPFVDLSSMVTPEVSPWQKQEVLKGVDNIAGTLAGGWGFHFVSNSTPYLTTWRTYTPAEASAMAEDGSIVTNAVFARNASAMFNPSATQEAQWETLAKYIPAVSSAAGKVDALGANDRDLNDAGSVSRPNGWGRPASEGEQPWLHSDIKNMALWFVGCFYDEIVTIGGLR